MEKDTKNLTAVAAISFILGMLIAFMAVLVAVAVTKPCGGQFGPAPYYHSFDKKPMVRMHRMEQRDAERAVRREQRPIIIVQTLPEAAEGEATEAPKAETK